MELIKHGAQHPTLHFFTFKTNIMKFYHYEFRNEKGQLVMNSEGSTGSIQQVKLKGWQIKNIERSLTAQHGVKCFVKLTKTESL